MRPRRFAECVRLFILLSFLIIFRVVCLQAQAGLTEGSVSGTVTDSTGAVIPGARVALSAQDESTTRATVTGVDGAFSLVGVASGAWQVRVSAAGFRSYENQSVAVAVGRDTRLDVALVPAQAAEQVTVHSQSTALDTSQTSPVTNIDRDRIEELPIPTRNYLSFTLLSPVVAAQNPAISQQALGSEAGGFSSGGLRPSSNALYIDGTDDNDEYTGLSRTQLSPEAISDFQIVNHGYTAEAGGSAGGSVEVETRAGANLQHGDAFLFVQNGAMNGTPALELAPHKPDESALRAGLSTGGALRKGRLFYYAAGEQELARGEEASDFTAATAAAIDAALEYAGPLRGFRLQQGFFPTTNEETELSGRFDLQGADNSLMLRYALTNNRSVNDAFGTDDLTDLSARGSAFYDDNSINGYWTHSFSPQWLNLLSYEVSQRRVDLRTGSVDGPGIVIPGIAHFGTPFSGNNRRYETHADFGESMVRHRGTHLMEAGFTAMHVGLRAADREGFQGLYVFPSIANLAVANPDFYIQSFGDPDTNFTETRWAAWAQDHWTPRRSLALDYGLRYEDNRVPGLPQHPLNFSPRFGFAWSARRNLVVRGGAGIFFDRYLLGTVNRVKEFNGRSAEQQVAEGAAVRSLYQAGSWYARPHAGIAPSIWQAQPNLANPYAETASFDVEREFPSQWTVSAEYRFVHGVKMGRTINANLLPPVTLTSANAGGLGVENPTAQQIGRAVFLLQRLNPVWDAINQFQTEANSNYNGATLTVNRQFTEEFEMMAGYTYAKTIDDASYDTEQPQNPYDLRAERALSLEDQRQRLVMSGLWVVGPDLDDPQDVAKARPKAFQRVVYGLEFAPILEADSGFRDNALTGTDSNLEHVYPFAARPLGYGRNALRTPAQVHFDFRVLRMVPIGRGHLDIVAESFNLLNRQNMDQLDPDFGQSLAAAQQFGLPIHEAGARRVQFSLDFEY
ncbi:MAG: carboxypeptidase regulatory-like domain-containing protein [Acidobacteriota bacterium]